MWVAKVPTQMYPEDAKEKESALLSQLPIPVSSCCLGFGEDGFEYSTQVISIFQNGFVISSPRKLRIGSLLSLRLRLPPEFASGPFREMRCTGHVAGEHSLKGEELRYKVELDSSALPA
jgi:hypothetical protein